jgi:D-aminopeptidase
MPTWKAPVEYLNIMLMHLYTVQLYGGHSAGNPEYNVMIEALPNNVKLFDTPDRCFLWRRIRGQSVQQPFGLITVGQHSRNCEINAYFPHSVQSPPIKSLSVNNKNIAEIGMCAYSFCETYF